MKTLLLSCMALAALVGQAEAAVMQTNTLPSGPYTSPVASSTSGEVFYNLSGSVSGLYRSPFENTSSPNGLFTSVEANGVATYNLSGDTFSLIWGSPDSYNQLSFFSGLNGEGTNLGTITGSQIIPMNGTGFSYVTVSGLGTFGSVQMTNNPGQNAFEVSTFSVSSVPLPASLPMFGGALLALSGLAWAARARRSATAPVVV